MCQALFWTLGDTVPGMVSLTELTRHETGDTHGSRMEHGQTSCYHTLQTLPFSRIKCVRQLCIEQVYQDHFANSICSFPVSASLCGSSHNILNFFNFIICVTVICDR